MSRPQILRALALAALAALVLGSSALAGDSPPLKRADDESPRVWLVELSGPAEDFRRRAREAGLEVRERRSFATLWNGVSVEVAPGDVAAVRELDGVAAVYPNVVASVPEPDASGAGADATAAARKHRGPDEVDGSGVTVALIDSGLDWQHPDLGSCFGSGCKVRRGWDFVGDAYDPNPASPTFSPTPVPDADPDDCNGHGTHVAGIVGANGRVQGVAPAVDLVSYRVTGCAGQVAADVMLAALERAHRDRVDVVNISIATPFLGWPDYPTAKAASRLVDRGIVVVAAIGNNGPAPTYAAGAPAVGEDVIGVASFDSLRSELAAFTISPDDRQVLFTPASGAPPAPLTGTHALSFQGPGCTPLAAGSLTGQIAVVVRGVCALHNKAVIAQDAGAVGVVLVNNVAGRFTPIVTGPVPVTIPFVGITLADGSLIVERLASGPVSLTWTDETGTEAVATGGAVSALSSWGLAADLSLKPDLGAPGGFVWSTYPLEKGRYANISGTSMASPHVAGAAALLLDAKPRTRAGDVRTILQNSADPANVLGTTLTDAVHRQGAGMVDVEGALSADTAVTPSKLSLGEGPGDTVRLTIANDGDRRRTYTLTHLPALATSNNTAAYTFAAFADLPATVTFSETSVSIGPGRRERVRVSITPHATLPDLATYGGYVVVDDGEGASFSVPYAGLEGDLQAIPIFTGHKLLVRQTAAGFEPVTDGAVFRLTGATETPTVLVHLDQHAQRLEAKLLRARDAAEVHRPSWSAFEVEYLPKSASPAAFLTIPWDGTRERSRGRRTRTKPVPDGSYRLVVRALRPLGDRSNAAHWDTFTTPTFTIDRP